MSIHSQLPYDQSTSHARIPAGGIDLIASIDSVSEAQFTASFLGSTKALHGEVATTSPATTTHNHSNQQYSITAVTTSAGAIAERYAYSAYGEPTILDPSGTVIASSSINNRYSYTGREWDATVGLYHFRARWMSPKSGRFLARDPIGFMGSAWDLYEMLATGPLVRIDPLGYRSGRPGDTPSKTIPDMLRQAIPCPVEIETRATNSCADYGGVKAGYPKCFKTPDPAKPGTYIKSFDVFCNDLDCEFSIFQWIKDRKAAYCKVDGVSTSCVDIDCPCDRKTCGKIWNNIRDNRGCWKAREAEANLCFIGRENAGHKQAREDAKRAFETCEDKKKECKCSYVFTP
jgi:RHS repeat-associated protein